MFPEGFEGLTTLPPSCADCLEIWEPQPPGTLGPVMGLLYRLYTNMKQDGQFKQQALPL